MAPIPFEAEFGSSEAACADIGFHATEAPAAIAAGTLTIDAGEADICLQSLPAQECKSFWSDHRIKANACERALAGKLLDAEACVSDVECAIDRSRCLQGACAPTGFVDLKWKINNQGPLNTCFGNSTVRAISTAQPPGEPVLDFTELCARGNIVFFQLAPGTWSFALTYSRDAANPITATVTFAANESGAVTVNFPTP